MKASTRKFEIKFNRSKNKIERIGVRLFYSMFSKMYKTFLKESKNLAPEQWESAINTINEDQVKADFVRYYRMFTPLGLMVRKNMLNQKAEDDVFWNNFFAQEMTEIVNRKTKHKIASITNTTHESIRDSINEVLDVANTEGLGVEEARRMLEKNIGANLEGNVRARARAIAQTEMISASNEAAKSAADSTGLDYRKFWSTSGLGGVRESHSADQEFSFEVEGLKPDEIFPNTLLSQPGDSSGAAAEVINCRCTLLTEIV